MPRLSFGLTLGAVLIGSSSLRAEERFQLAESFPPGAIYRVEQKTELAGRLTLNREGRTESIPLTGNGAVIYDERILRSDDPDTQKVFRRYRSFDVSRTVGGRRQSAELRAAVRRLVVLRSNRGKSPFSPDGALLWTEIDAVRTDPFLPALVPALLPAKAVAVNDTWTLGSEAISELTDMEKVTAGGFTVKLAGVVTLNGRRQARLSLTGSVRGVDDNGPCKHTLDGTAYFDLAANRLAYLSLKGTHDLLDGTGKTTGSIEGRFTVTRTVADAPAELSDDALAGVELKPTAENSAILYENGDLGLRFQYSRRWRVGAVQGRQLTLDGPNGAGILLTVESKQSLPGAAAFQRESEAFLKKTARDVAVVRAIARVSTGPALDRFALSATTDGAAIRMEYAVLTNADGTGATVATRLPATDAKELAADLDQILKTLTTGKSR